MSGLGAVIQSLHAIVSMTRAEPHWMVNDADAKAYANAIGNVARHFPIGATQKSLDFFALAMIAGQIEIPRMTLSWQAARAKAAGAARVGQVVSFHAPPGPRPVADSMPGFVRDGIDSPLGGA